jgi:biopolymer transport protein ExbD
MPLKTLRDEQPSLNLTPMIDIIFQLVLFFMVGTKFSEFEERGIGLSVPQVSRSSAPAVAPGPHVVNVYRDGAVTLDGADVALDELASRLAAFRAGRDDMKVLVRADGAGAFQHVARALSAVKEAGVGELGISVRLQQDDR